MADNQALRGPINVKRPKADLVAIASAIGIGKMGTVKELTANILKALGTPEIQSQLDKNPALVNLVGWYKDNYEKDTSGKKTSADKTHEDAVEDGKPAAAPSGYVPLRCP